MICLGLDFQFCLILQHILMICVLNASEVSYVIETKTVLETSLFNTTRVPQKSRSKSRY